MISTRRIAAAVGLAAGVTGLAAPLAQAAPAAHHNGLVSPIATLDSLAGSGIPAEHRAGMPRAGEQLAGLNRVHELGQLHQLTDLAAPVTGLLPGIG